MTPPSPRPTLFLYGRPDCELCDEARVTLQVALEERAIRGESIPHLRTVDVESDPELEARYGSLVPVLAVDGRELALATGGRRIRTFLDQTLGRLA